ncbi:MAG: bifunctional DNA-formamidopyrimidine glycosylase/DNA-(apurinic or apyrimidinic site) lyase [Acidobacteria bacterium]|nr:bifunctional DNA-formamidopyrimidine glycosylase/DNA-(apurinic or apyrimidinic site) lyase [Acidobacteriota bacterium]
MPELPEVETIVRGLKPLVEGRLIESVEIVAGLVVKSPIDAVEGQIIRATRRLGKNVLFECTRGILSIHLGMTGKLLADGALTPYTRVIFHLNGATLLYDDIRQFGRLHYAPELPQHLALIGPDPLRLEASDFLARLKRKKGRIKPLLLNQHFLAGLGNIYVDEALFRAGIHPNTLVSAISKPRAARLHTAIQETLHEAIHHGGSSISDYVDAAGRKGSFQERHRVYDREGAPCIHCGTPIRRIVIGQRGTHFCPKCQKG